MRTRRHDPTKIRRLLEQRSAEGLTFQKLSELSGVPVHVFTYRASQDRLISGRDGHESTGFVEVIAAGSGDDVAPAARAAGIELLLAGGLRVRLDRDFDEAALSRLLATLRC